MLPDAVDDIYECSFLPDLWPGVLERLAGLADARGAHFIAIGQAGARWTSSPGLAANMAVMMQGGWLLRGERLARLRAADRAGFVTETDVYTQDEMAADPFYRDLMWKCGLGWGAGMLMPLPTGETLLLSVERDRKRGPIEPAIIARLDALRPHLARSALMSARLGLERARAASDTLALIGLPALVFDAGGLVLAANTLIEAMGGHIVWRARDGMALRDAGAERQFRQAVASLDAEAGLAVGSFAVRDAHGAAALVAHVVPVRGHVRDIFSRSMGVLVLTAVGGAQAPSVALVQSLFDLTPAEARVARQLAAGGTVAEIAAAGTVSLATVRTQVRGVLEKTGCRRQAEVAALLQGMSRGAPAAQPA